MAHHTAHAQRMLQVVAHEGVHIRQARRQRWAIETAIAEEAKSGVVKSLDLGPLIDVAGSGALNERPIAWSGAPQLGHLAGRARGATLKLLRQPKHA